MSDGKQRRSKITYAGHEYAVPAVEGQKVIEEMAAQVPTHVRVNLTTERSLWMVLGPGVAVTVLEDQRESASDNAVYF